MSDVTLEEFAKLQGVSIDKVIGESEKAGLKVSGPKQRLSGSEQEQLEKIMSKTKKVSLAKPDSKKISLSLKKRASGEVKVQRTGGEKSTVNIVRKKKRTYVKRTQEEIESEKRLQEELELKKKQEEDKLKAEKKAKEEKAKKEKAKKDKEAIKAFQAKKTNKKVIDGEKKDLSDVQAVDSSYENKAEILNDKDVDTKLEPKNGKVFKKKSVSKETIDIKSVVEEVAVQPEVKEKEEMIVPVKKDIKIKRVEKDDVEDASVKPKLSEVSNKKKSQKAEENDFGTKKPKLSDKKDKGKRKNKISVYQSEERDSYKKRGKFKSKKEEPENEHGFSKPTKPIIYEVSIPEFISVADLSQKISTKSAFVIKELMKLGVMATINQMLDQETAILVVEELGHKAVAASAATLEDDVKIEYDLSEEQEKAPVVTVMGHVDHGKTSLLDYIRKSRVASRESGGITQHIGAYHVENDKHGITFLDTPGHAAFTAMRARGAQCTDIVILVVAADDGVMPQTIEAIKHAKAANVSIIVAINKIDKPESDIEKIKSEVSQYGLIPEDWGGDVMFIPVSAKEGTGVDKLLESVALQAEMLELKACPTGIAKGIVVEASLDKGRGPVATILIQNGTLKKGDIMLAGSEYGRARALINSSGESIDSAGPAIPVEVLGLSNVPQVGDEFVVVSDEKKAREVALFRQVKYKEIKLAKQQATKLEGFLDRMDSKDKKELNIIIKADVGGSSEALSEALRKLSKDEVKVNVVFAGVGGITESDIHLAIASKAVLVGFNVRADVSAKKLAQKEEITIYYHSIIYNVIDDVKAAIGGLLGVSIKETIIGLAEVRDVFRSAKLGSIAGCMVIDGIVKRGRPIRVLRDNIVIYEGELESLRRFKDDASEVRNGTECGIGVKNYNDVKVGDQIECYEVTKIQRTFD